MNDLQGSWEKFGFDSIECKTLQKKIDFYNEKDNSEFMRMKKEISSLPAEMNKLTFKPNNKYFRKGRKRDPMMFKEDNEKKRYQPEDFYLL